MTGRGCTAALIIAAVAGGCDGWQSTLAPAGRDAEQIAELFWVMAAGAALIWLLVIGAAMYAVVRGNRQHSERASRWFIVGGGVVLPTVVLTVLLVFGLRMLPDLLDLGPDPEPVAAVSAEQWWWRVAYRLPDGEVIELANEVRVPIGARVALAIDSPDVVHSLWIPALAGKVDAIPGRTTYLGLEATRAGVFRGVCAEYCGQSHARMLFHAVAMPADDYEAWLEHQAEPAAPPATALAERGQRAFLAYGCGACHTVRGTPADGAVGPDLTHVGSRIAVAGVLENDVDGFRRWLTRPGEVKPGVHMPGYHMVDAADLTALATYLESLQ